jgi:uncharacterized protein (DUF1684 family)
VIWLLTWLTMLTTEAARPVQLAKSAATDVVRVIEKDRLATQEWLRADPTSYLATTERRDFGEKKTLTIGSAADNDIHLAGQRVASHHLRVTVVGDKFHVESVSPQFPFKAGANLMTDAVVDPSNVQIDRFTLRLSHQRFPAIIVFDTESARFKQYKGLKYFPVDLAYRYELPMTLDRRPEAVVIMSTRGNQRQAVRVGWFDFLVGETPCRLEVMRLDEPGVGENDLQVLFRDTTSGIKTYPLGRYVDVKKLPSGNYLLDFNMAYNPACAYSDHYNCPIPPTANTLKVAIRAGEMDSHYH